MADDSRALSGSKASAETAAERSARIAKSWEETEEHKEERRLRAQFPKTPDAAGKRCAVVGCPKTRGISYYKPLCFAHWRLFDRFEIEECERCHWFEDDVSVVAIMGLDDINGLSLCYECFDRRSRGFPPAAVYAHGDVVRRIRYLYFLKLSDGRFYIGQTNNLKLRLSEHQDGTQKSTKGLDPKLVYFQTYVGDQSDLNDAEDRYTLLSLNKPRAIRQIVEEWQSPLRLVTIT